MNTPLPDAPAIIVNVIDYADGASDEPDVLFIGAHGIILTIVPLSMN